MLERPPRRPSTLDQISSASCSTHPGRGDASPTGAAPYPATWPASSTTTALELVVPWSIDKIMRRSSDLLAPTVDVHPSTGLDVHHSRSDTLCEC